MAISIPAFQVTMYDAEFIKINGVAAPTIPPSSPFYNRNLSASSSGGVTAIALAASQARDPGTLKRFLDTLRRAAQANGIQITMT